MKYYPKEIYYEVRGNVHYIVLVYEDSKVEHVIAAQPALALDASQDGSQSDDTGASRQ